MNDLKLGMTDGRWKRLESAPDNENFGILITTHVDRGVYEDVVYNTKTGDVYRRRWWTEGGRVGEAWFAFDRQQEKRFGGRPGLSKEDIARETIMVLETGEDKEFTEEEIETIVEWMASRMTDTTAQRWADDREQVEEARLANDVSEDGMYDWFAEIDTVLLNELGLDGNPGYELPDEETPYVGDGHQR